METTIVLLWLLCFLVLLLIITAFFCYQIINLKKQIDNHNKDIIMLLKYKNESTMMILQHIEILKYLVDKDSKPGITTKNTKKWEA